MKLFCIYHWWGDSTPTEYFLIARRRPTEAEVREIVYDFDPKHDSIDIYEKGYHLLNDDIR